MQQVPLEFSSLLVQHYSPSVFSFPLSEVQKWVTYYWDDCYSRLAELISLKHYSKSTLDSYKLRIRQFEQYLKGKSPSDVTKSYAEKFLTYLTFDQMDHFEKLKALHKTDIGSGVGPVNLPKALLKKYIHAEKEFAWQWFFPANTLYYDKENNFHCRYHIHDTAIQKVIKKATLQTAIPKRISAHTFRHSFATHLL